MSEFRNYFNYFTEIEEHFQRARGTGLFLLSPLDWALIESWKASDVPLEAVFRGIDGAFEKWRARRSRVQKVNSLAFCAQAVMAEAQRAPASPASQSEPFSPDEIRNFLERNTAELAGRAGFEEIATSLRSLAASPEDNVEDLERHLTVIEQRMIAIARANEPEKDALAARRELDQQLRPYRQKMTAEQLAMLERQFLDRKLLENARLPRLSLFYLH